MITWRRKRLSLQNVHQNFVRLTAEQSVAQLKARRKRLCPSFWL